MASSPPATTTPGELFSAESYFATQPPPPTLDDDVKGVREFIARQNAEGRRVALVTVSPYLRDDKIGPLTVR
jgi:phosphopantothenate-cysteine ligase